MALHNFRTRFINYILPRVCLICQSNCSLINLCRGCYSSLSFACQQDRCYSCAILLSYDDSIYCKNCKQKPDSIACSFVLLDATQINAAILRKLKTNIFWQDLIVKLFVYNLRKNHNQKTPNTIIVQAKEKWHIGLLSQIAKRLNKKVVLANEGNDFKIAEDIIVLQFNKNLKSLKKYMPKVEYLHVWAISDINIKPASFAM